MRFLKMLAGITAAVFFYAIPVLIGNLFISGWAWEGIKIAWVVAAIVFGIAAYRYLQRPAKKSTPESQQRKT